jgi:hypothetical protein
VDRQVARAGGEHEDAEEPSPADAKAVRP